MSGKQRDGDSQPDRDQQHADQENADELEARTQGQGPNGYERPDEQARRNTGQKTRDQQDE